MFLSSLSKYRGAALLTTLLALSLVSILVGRGAGDRASVLETHLRFIEEDPRSILSEESLQGGEQVFSWQFSSESPCVEIWPSTRKNAEIQFDGHKAQLRWEEDRMNVFVDAAIATSSVNRIDVLLQSFDTKLSRTGRMVLQWSSSGEKFSWDRSVREPHGEVVSDNARRYHFSLGSHPGWRSTVSRLRLVILPPLGSQVALCSIQGYGSVALHPERLADLAADGFKVALGGQYRNALPGYPGHPIERELEVPPNAELRFAYGLQPGLRVPMSLRLTARTGRREIDLFEISLSPADAGSWHDATVALASLSGRRVTLRFETVASGIPEQESGIVLWANPEVVAERRLRRQIWNWFIPRNSQ